MNKLTYWMRKTGMLRTSSYKVKGDAEKLNEVVASDGEMLQSQKEIDEQYQEENTKKKDLNQVNNSVSQNNNQNKKGSNSKVLFWIFLVIGSICSVMILMNGFSIWFLLVIAMWGWFLQRTWKKTTTSSLMIGKTIFIGVIFIILSFFFIEAALPGPEEARKEYDEVMSQFDTNDTKQEVKKEAVKIDKISQFLTELKKDTKIDFNEITNDSNVVWTNGGAGLKLNQGKSMTVTNNSKKEWTAIQKYFENLDGTQGTIGMKFVDKGDGEQSGYYFTSGDYYMLMCVLVQTDKNTTVKCGWGPGGGK